MAWSYDHQGFLSDTEIPGRTTDVAPPPASDWPAGKRPNWTGHQWIYLDFPPPPLPPAGPRVLTKLDFMDRFTDAELSAILAASKSDVSLEVWLKKLEMAGEVDLDSPRVINALDNLEAAGLLAAGRADEILGVK